VTSPDIAGGAVTAPGIAAGAVTLAKRKLAMEIDADVAKRVEDIANAHGRTLDDVVEMLLRAGLGAHDALEWARDRLEALIAQLRTEIEALRARLEAQQLPVA
jgi:hypothetical protein